MTTSLTPHGLKLDTLSGNSKLSPAERERVLGESIPRYRGWVQAMDSLTSEGTARVQELTELLNEYKYYVELELIFSSPDDFLYRQAGQIKLGASIIEEFLPRLTHPTILPELDGVAYETGSHSAYSGAYFSSDIHGLAAGAGFTITKKDQDFTIGIPIWMRASTDPGFATNRTVSHASHLAYVAAECKTNLDKTMFQEAAATARDLKAAVVGARYYLICDWLDMTPMNTSMTSIDEVIILRGKRMGSGDREGLAKHETRQRVLPDHEQWLRSHPVRVHSIERFVGHLRSQFNHAPVDSEEVVARGYF